MALELAILAAPILVALLVLVAVLLSVYEVISAPRWTWISFIGFSLLACAPLASLVGYLITAPLSWSRPEYSGLVVAPVAFVLAILLMKRGARITARRRAVVVWTARAGATALGLFFTVVWLLHFWEYYVSKVTHPVVRDDPPVLDLTHTDKEIAAFPDDPGLRIRRASERARFLKDRPGATEDLERYRTLTQDALGYHITKARLLHHDFGDCVAAIAEYDAALPLAPTVRAPPDYDNPPIVSTVGQVYGERAECYQALGRTEAAIDGYSAAIQHDPENGAWWRKRGELLLQQGCRDILHSQKLPGGYVPRSTRPSGDERNRCAESAPR
jgi:hypothetical protein